MYKISGSTKKGTGDQSVTKGYVERELKLDEFIEYINSRATVIAKLKNNYRRSENVEEIHQWIRFDVDAEGEDKFLDDKLKDMFYIKKPSTNHDKYSFKWHYFVKVSGMHKDDVYKYKWQARKFCEEMDISLKDMRATEVVVQNLNPYKNGMVGGKSTKENRKHLAKAISLTQVNHGKVVWEAPKAPDNISWYGSTKVSHNGDVTKIKPYNAVQIVKRSKHTVILDRDGYIKSQGGWIKLSDLDIQTGEQLSQLACPVCNEEHSDGTGLTCGYAFAYARGNRKFIKCGGTACSGVSYEIQHKDLIDEVLPTVVDIEKIEAYLGNCGWNPVKRVFVWLSSSGKVRTFTETEIPIFFKDISSDDLISESDKEVMLKNYESEYNYRKYIYGQMVAYIKFYNQYETIRVKVNPFGNNTIHFAQNKMNMELNHVLPRSVVEVIDEKVVNDYKEHFPELDDVIDLMLAARFGADKKNCYLWMKAVSNWGKSMLFDNIINSRLGLVTMLKEAELKKALKGDPVGIVGNDFIYSWILLFEEFSGAVSELKDITHHMSFAPKGASRVTIDLYMKVFLSAEQVQSLEGDIGTDGQFSNRFMKMELNGTIVGREIYDRDQEHYKSVVASYIYRRLQDGVDMYITMGEKLSSKHAQAVLAKFRPKHLMKSSNLDLGIAEIREGFLSTVIADLDFGGNDRWEDYFFINKKALYTNNKGKAKELFVNHSFDRKTQAMVSFKTSDQLLNIDSKKVQLRNKSYPGGKKWGYFIKDLDS